MNAQDECILDLVLGLVIFIASMMLIRLSVPLRWYYLVSFLVVFAGVVGLALIVHWIERG